jgi:multidrug efflux pump subunit AcrB
VQVPQAQMKGLEDLRNLPVTSMNHEIVPLRNIAKVSEGTVVGQYDRYNMARTVSVTANIHGSDLGSVAAQVEKALAEIPPPTGVNVALRGQVQPMKELQAGLRLGLVTAIVVIFLLLIANFQSVRLALAVVTAVPAVILGVALALWFTHTTLNIQSFMGAIMAVGVAVANAILLVTFASRAHHAGLARNDAAVHGATSRLRPILMTSFAMIAGMIPLALSGGTAGPLGKAVVGGLALGTVATLFLLPAAFALLTRKQAVSPSLDPDEMTN